MKSVEMTNNKLGLAFLIIVGAIAIIVDISSEASLVRRLFR